MSNTEIINEEPNIPETVPQSTEDKFFGKQTEIDSQIPEGLEVEVVDDTPEEDRRPAKAEDTSPDIDDETVDKEISDYSKRAGERIAKLNTSITKNVELKKQHLESLLKLYKDYRHLWLKTKDYKLW